MRKTISAVAVAAALILGSAGAASAIEYPSGALPGSTVTVSPGSASTLTFHGFEPGERVTFTVTGVHSATVTIAAETSLSKNADSSGSVSFTVTAPESAGALAMSLEGASAGAVWTATLDVEASTTSSESLASTGVENLGLVLGAGGLLVVGVGAVVAAARRNTASKI